jgi:hypothetical protein
MSRISRLTTTERTGRRMKISVKRMMSARLARQGCDRGVS